MTGTIPSTGTPTYTWKWLVAVNGGGYEPATQCTVNGGSEAVGGATETCSIPANTLTAGDSYSFELQVTDNATTPVTLTSAATSAVSVTSPSSSFPWWIYVVIAVVVLLALILLALVVVRRRRTNAVVEPWLPGPLAPSAPATVGIAAWVETDLDEAAPDAARPVFQIPVADRGEATQPVTPILEATPPLDRAASTPKPSDRPPEPSAPVVDALAAALAAVPVSEPAPEADSPPPAAPEVDPGTVAKTEFDIDSVLAELDAISGEILKSRSKKASETKPDEDTENSADR
ncbi:MAG: hypothetical protein ABSA63_09050 [Thermoplasmata archaeon]